MRMPKADATHACIPEYSDASITACQVGKRVSLECKIGGDTKSVPLKLQDRL